MKILDLLEKYNISASDLAEKLKVKRQTISQYIYGERTLSEKMKYRIFYALYEISNEMKKKSESLHNALREIDFELYKKSVHEFLSKEIDLHK